MTRGGAKLRPGVLDQLQVLPRVFRLPQPAAGEQDRPQDVERALRVAGQRRLRLALLRLVRQ